MRASEADFALRQRFLAAVLAALLIAFAVWCIVLLLRTLELRADLDLHLGWLEDVRMLRGEVERQRAAQLEAAKQPQPESGAPAVSAELGSSGRVLVEMLDRLGDPQLAVSARALEQTLARLEDSLASPGDGGDAVWEASSAALAATSPLATGLQHRVSRILRRLDRHWTSLNLLVTASLLLAGSNLSLLLLAHRRRRELAESKAELERRGSHDSLTGLWNRAAILRLLREELARSERTGLPLGVVLADLDSFHQVNVLLGQDRGDFILQQLAERLRSMVRPYDTLGRFAGDAFLLVLPSCEAMATADVAERLRSTINERDVDHGLGKIRVTLSLAHTTLSAGDDHDPDLLLHRLQERLDGAREERGPGRIVAL